MKKFTLAFGIILTNCFHLTAQPVLTSSMLNPVPTEVFYGHLCDVTGITPGSSGAAVTWNFSTLSEIDKDTSTYISCGPGYDCDSFPGSNIVMFDNYDYFYGIADTSKLALTGANISSVNVHLAGEDLQMYYPMSYGSSRVDSYYTAIPFVQAYRELDSLYCDGYGTLILPSGSYSNVLRVHTVAYVWDTSSSGIEIYRTENYNWFASGFHHSLLDITVDTSAAAGTYTSNVEYYTNGGPLNVKAVNNNSDIITYPNPATDVLHLKYNASGNENTSITLNDITGRVIITVDNSRIKPGMNEIDIPLAGIPAGMYVVHVSDNGNSISRKVFVSK